jgi:hypothetical protein
MGKAALIFVLAASIAVAYGTLSNQETGFFTAKSQANYEENVLAREIAKSGFNTAMAILRQHGDSLQAGVKAVNGELGYLEGEHHGGTYRARAIYLSGHSVEVISNGFFGGEFNADGEYVGGAEFRIDDTFIHELPRSPLHVGSCGALRARIIASESNYCSAVYLQRHIPGAGAASEPELLFASGRNRDGGQLVVPAQVQPGTQMNLFIGVDKSCAQQPADWQTYDYGSHTFNAGNYDHIHYALNVSGGSSLVVSEGIWSMVDQHPANNQRWRIAWEDQHKWNVTNPQHGHYKDPQRSLMGLKMFGYNGAGWPHTDAQGYRTLQRHVTDRPDLSDQVLDVWIENDGCGAAPSEEEGGGEEAGGADGGGDEGGETVSAEACPCPIGGNNTRKVLVMHRPAGNPGNEQAICISESAVPHHMRLHDDYIICRGQ